MRLHVKVSTLIFKTIKEMIIKMKIIDVGLFCVHVCVQSSLSVCVCVFPICASDKRGGLCTPVGTREDHHCVCVCIQGCVNCVCVCV